MKIQQFLRIKGVEVFAEKKRPLLIDIVSSSLAVLNQVNTFSMEQTCISHRESRKSGNNQDLGSGGRFYCKFGELTSPTAP